MTQRSATTWRIVSLGPASDKRDLLADGVLRRIYGTSYLESDCALTMLASMICPFPDFVLSSRARTIPRAQLRPPPAKSAIRFNGA